MQNHLDILNSESAIAGYNQTASSPPSHSRSPSCYRQYQNELLDTDLSKHQHNTEKLFEWCKALQDLGQKQRTELSNLNQTQSAGSTRRRTDDSNCSHKKHDVQSTRKGIAIVFDPSDNKLGVIQRGEMKDSDYIKAPLPSFHWWQDCLHIYFSKNRETNGQPEVIVLKKKSEPCLDRDGTFIRTIKLGKLGFSIIVQRILGRLNIIYVLSPEHVEMTILKSPHGLGKPK